MEPRQRSQFLVVAASDAVDHHPVGGEGRSCRADSMVLVMGQRVSVSAAAAAAGDYQIVATASTAVYEFMVRVHLFSRQEYNISDTVHAFRSRYIILAQMSLLEHDQLGLRRRQRLLPARWRQYRRRRRRRGSVAKDRCHAIGSTVWRRM